jgi:hypothetical protein
METMFETLIQIMADIKEGLNNIEARLEKLESKTEQSSPLKRPNTPEHTPSDMDNKTEVKKVATTQTRKEDLIEAKSLENKTHTLGVSRPYSYSTIWIKVYQKGSNHALRLKAVTEVQLFPRAGIGGLLGTVTNVSTSFSIHDRKTAVASLLENLRFTETQTHYTNRAQFWHQSGNRPSLISQTYHPNKTDANNHYMDHYYSEFSIPPSTSNEVTLDTLSSFKGEPLLRSTDINVRDNAVLNSTCDHDNNKREQPEFNIQCHEPWRNPTVILRALLSSSRSNKYGQQHCALTREHLH